MVRSHCAVCGTPISYETARRPGEIDLYLNAFDEPQLFSPGGHAFFEEHIPWFDTRDDLPRGQAAGAVGTSPRSSDYPAVQ